MAKGVGEVQFKGAEKREREPKGLEDKKDLIAFYESPYPLFVQGVPPVVSKDFGM